MHASLCAFYSFGGNRVSTTEFNISLRTDVDTLNEIHERMDTDYPNSEHIIYPLVRKTYRRGCIAVNIKMPELPGKLHCYAWYTRIK